MDKNYDHKDIQKRWNQIWEEGGCFKTDGIPTFTMAMPPPNVTGNLHLGHALNNTLQDIIIRFKRMSGEKVKWIPGLDHGGIATESVITKQLAKEKTNKFKIGRNDFISRTDSFISERKKDIINQLKEIGCSCDWDCLQYTMDDGYTSLVKQTFKELYEANLIYRGNYLINWCSKCSTPISDMEVNFHENEGKMYYLNYQLDGEDKYITVASTRPETLFGDTVLAFHPEDERYTHLKNKYAIIPIIGKKIPLIADPCILKDFGTELVKITPGHDKNDFLISQKHSLPIISILDEYGKLSNTGTKYDGMTTSIARNKIIEELNLVSSPYKNKIGKCYRCENIIEPRISLQWFVRMKSLMDKVKDTKVEFFPSFNSKLFQNWLDKDTDWCISRQIWWGHSIPIWYCQTDSCKEIICEEKCPSKCEKIHQSVSLSSQF